ncbi:uncharacterized protein LAESUDRAFT_562452 [Laetiporus sulphureus 93-53]|uniref:Uncharacterized protein n=1 Tax=Laetiporus sulphureus 93-53 TaxID=1314785 RepID=A0A165B4N6_9APHY|nr:uncharacterized protein LAESUDRAFT_562452 [Laetiporus sulphureus 93-53]KZT00226.1 hypothetical protein LAESUDRAFT_562452 [Laetiporus sulphureus 93-53]
MAVWSREGNLVEPQLAFINELAPVCTEEAQPRHVALIPPACTLTFELPSIDSRETVLESRTIREAHWSSTQQGAERMSLHSQW